MRLTVQDLKNSRIAPALGLCLSSASDKVKFMAWLNEAQERMLVQGRWWGSIVEAQFCVRDGCLTWPREVGTIEQVALCKSPIPIENQWYAYTINLARIEDCEGCRRGGGSCNGSGTGSLGCGCGHIQMRMRNQQCAFSLTRGANKVLRFYPTHSSDVGKTILVQGYDENKIWVRTNPTGSQVIDGEQVILALPYVDTLTTWYPGSPTALQKQSTNYRVLMYEYDTVADTSRKLGDYEPSETNPFYRTSNIPFFKQINCCDNKCDSQNSSDSSQCDRPKTVTALVKLAHIPLIADQDWVLFQNIPAYKEAMLAVRDWENGDIVSGNYHFYGSPAPKQARASNQATLSKGGAIPMLRAELRSMTGDNTTAYVHHEATNKLPCVMAGFI